ncbi:hypothetical protein EJB05_10930 [Eragrostis curvula]|uniref:DUF6598 domain-containing protein n=1 Tax=Eragrostis curvula TaxID=38414 RepID=A0A5J9VQ36_9POAL|nr:hypothetical protein EJB05_10930 [Eragrostis curvula]
MEEEEGAVAHSADKPESSSSEKKPEGKIDSPEPEVVPSSDDEDDETWDLFAPMSEGMARRLRKRAAAIPVAERRRRERERELAWQKWNEEDVRAHQHEWLHRHEIRASRFRDEWMADWSRYASFEDITEIKPMRFTDEPAPPRYATPCDTLQVFSVKVTGIRGGLQWPVDVFGLFAVRDCVDQKRNIIFLRDRDDSQTLTEEVDTISLFTILFVCLFFFGS